MGRSCSKHPQRAESWQGGAAWHCHLWINPPQPPHLAWAAGERLLPSPRTLGALAGAGSNGFAAWKAFISLLIASPGPTESRAPSCFNHFLLPCWVPFPEPNVCAVFVCLFMAPARKSLACRIEPALLELGRAVSSQGSHWNSSHESTWTPPSLLLSPRASSAASVLALEVSQQGGAAGQLHFVIFGVDF